MNLTIDEYQDLFNSVRIVCPKLEEYYQSEALNIAIQDGPASGQSVPHVHVHILPRKSGDFKRNGVIYEKLEAQRLGEYIRLGANRTSRSLEEMAAEATVLRSLFS